MTKPQKIEGGKKEYRTISVALLITILYLISVWKITGTWKEIEFRKLQTVVETENAKLVVERNRALNEVCGNNGGNYQGGTINCN